MKRVIITLISLAAVALVAFTLYNNKEEMKENAKLAEVTTDAIPVRVTKLSKKALNKEVKTDATFEAKTDLTILSETQGKIVKVYKEKGDEVKKGDLLAQVENELLQAQVAAAEANYEKFKSDKERFTKLSQSDAITGRQLEDVSIGLKDAEAKYRSAKKNLENTYIRATASGSINDDFIQEGLFINPGAKLYEIVDISILKLDARLTAAEVVHVNEGDEVTITTQLYPGEVFKGTVTAVASKADVSLKYGVEVTLNNKEGKQLKPGMYATVNFNFVNDIPGYYLDRNALVGSIQNPQVYIVEDHHAVLKDINVGDIDEDQMEILGGLGENDLVVTTGQINLEEGTNVNVLK